jgi:putative DNA primase/helicase
MNNNIGQFIEVMKSAGLTPPNLIEPEKLYRFSGADKSADNKSGWCKLFADETGGVYGDWSQDLSASWQAKRSTPYTQAESEALNLQIAKSKALAEEDKREKQLEAAKGAESLWRDAQPATNDHAYLVRKGIKAHGAKKHRGDLVIPVREGAATRSLQFIGDDGTKRFLPDGRVKGCYFSIGNTKDAAALCIAEGFATGATIHEATGYPVAVAFNAGNLKAVALAMRAKLPDMTLIVCADDDYKTDGNPGLKKATDAAIAVNGKLAIPDFGENRQDGATDFNDMAVHCRAEMVRKAIEAARSPDGEMGQPAQTNATENAYAGGRFVTLVSAADIAPEAISWLWDGWLAAGKFHILGGAPGTGKTTLAIALAATVSCGGRWPDGTKANAGNVLIWSGEDDPANTLVPRLIASGANLERVKFVTGTDGASGKLPFDPANDMKALEDAAQTFGNVRLLIVDPVVSAVAGDSHKNTETRRALQPLVDLGAALNCAVLGITHFSKGTGGRDPTERIIGSIAFAALARVVMIAAKKTQVEEGEPSRMFARSKSNIGADDGGFSYDLVQTELANHPGVTASHVLWGAAIDGTAREILASAETSDDDGEGGAIGDACAFLTDLLANGEVSAKQVKAAASDAGLSWRTIERAKKSIGAVAAKTGMQGGWVWKIPEDRQKKPKDAYLETLTVFDKVGGLNEKSAVSNVPSEEF